MSQRDVADEELFQTAAQHFTGVELTDEELRAIWQLLQRGPQTSEELASHITRPLEEVEAFLEWCAGQGIVASANLESGERIFGPADGTLANDREPSGERSNSLRRAEFTALILVGFVVLYVTAPYLAAIPAGRGLAAPFGTWIGLVRVGLIAAFVAAVAALWFYVGSDRD